MRKEDPNQSEYLLGSVDMPKVGKMGVVLRAIVESLKMLVEGPSLGGTAEQHTASKRIFLELHGNSE